MRLVGIGICTLALLFIVYARYQDPANLTPDAIHVVQRMAYMFYVVMAAAFGAMAYGMYKYHAAKVEQWRLGLQNDLSAVIAMSTWNSKSRRIFAVTFVAYGIFFSLSSGTLVYQPGLGLCHTLWRRDTVGLLYRRAAMRSDTCQR